MKSLPKIKSVERKGKLLIQITYYCIETKATLYDPEKLKTKVSLKGINKINKAYTKINKKKDNIDWEFDKILKSIEIERPMLLKSEIESLSKSRIGNHGYDELKIYFDTKVIKITLGVNF